MANWYARWRIEVFIDFVMLCENYPGIWGHLHPLVSLQNGGIPLILQIGKIQNTRLVKNVSLSTSCDVIYKHLIRWHYHWNHPETNSLPLFFFCEEKDLMQIRSTFRSIQYMTTFFYDVNSHVWCKRMLSGQKFESIIKVQFIILR